MRRALFSLFLGLLGLVTTTTRAQTLVHGYAFAGNLNDSVGSVALTYNNAVGVGSGSLSANPGYYTFAAGQGLSFAGESGLRTDYTIAMRFSFNTTGAYQRMIDFANLTSDNGMYTLGTSFNFYPVTSGGTITANQSVDFILTRSSATNTVTGYVGTTQVFSFTDTSNYAVATLVSGQSVFGFFRDDGGENAAGRIDSLLFYNGALSGTAIGTGMVGSALTSVSAVPEPATTAAWMGAVALAGAVYWRRKRRPAA